MITVVVYKEDTKEVLAAVPLEDGEKGICRNDVGFQIFNGTEPVFSETPDGLILKDNSFIINIGG